MLALGPKYGYHPKPSKTYLIAKNVDSKRKAVEIFGESEDGITITLSGHRHIGAVIGNNTFKEKFVFEKVDMWVKDVKELAKIAMEEPQAALSALNVGLSQRWKYTQRVIGGIPHLFQPLEEAIKGDFIPALCGRSLSDVERRIVALPYRYGGLGICDPTASSEEEYQASKKITAQLTQLIYQQNTDTSEFDHNAMKEIKKAVRKEKDVKLRESTETILGEVDEKTKRLLKAAAEKGASSWLSVLPLKQYGYVLNKQEFRDGLCLRYGWEVAEVPKSCACGMANTIDHILIL